MSEAQGKGARGGERAPDEGDRRKWPMGQTPEDRGSRPLIFDPHGFLVAVLGDAEGAASAQDALERLGFAPGDLRMYTGAQIQDDHARFLEQRSFAGAVVGALTDDAGARDRYLAYAREGRAALWVYAPAEADARRALRTLADFPALHIRYYGQNRFDDFELGPPRWRRA